MKHEIFRVTNNLGQLKGLSPPAVPDGISRLATIIPEELLAILANSVVATSSKTLSL